MSSSRLQLESKSLYLFAKATARKLIHAFKSALGTKRTCRPRRVMSAAWGKSGRIGDAPVLPLMTQSGHSNTCVVRLISVPGSL